MASMRFQAASNGRSIDCSHDGQWITVAGGGGYRGPGGGQGYGTGVLSSDDSAKLEGFYASPAYPVAALFSPAAGQIAVISTGELNLYNLGNQTSIFKDAASFSSSARWTMDGRYLFAGMDAAGIRVYQNTLSPEESAYAAARIKALKYLPPVATADSARKEASWLKNFTPTSSLQTALNSARQALSGKSGERLPDWTGVPYYTENKAAYDATKALFNNIDPQNNQGVTIYNFKEVLKQTPDYPPALLGLGIATAYNKDDAGSLPFLMKAINLDAGRSSISGTALNFAGQMYIAHNKEAEGIHCLSATLMLDRDNEIALGAAANLLPKHGITVKTNVSTPIGPASANPVGAKLKLPAQRKSAQTMTAEQIYGLAAERSVTIKTDTGYGSGICITDEGHILTCAHVITGRADGIEVTTYTRHDKRIVPGASLKAAIVFSDRDNDIAVLKVENPPKTLLALSLAKDDPTTGQKIYAIGSPVMGSTVLNQTFTTGIISSEDRIMDNLSWVQHTAAVNGGNSGGPLISEQGEIIGVVSLKANLENTGFAVPAKRILPLLK